MKNGLAMVMMIAATPCKSIDDSVLFLTSGFCLTTVTGSWKFSGISSAPGVSGHTEDKYILLNNSLRADSANGIEMIIDNVGNLYLLNTYGDFYQYNTVTDAFNFYLATPIADGSTIFSSAAYSDEFTSLDMATPSHTLGAWRPNEDWQDLSKGYKDFAGTSWNISPNDAAPFTTYPPFAINSGILTISSFRTPAALNTPIQTEMTTQGTAGPVPAWCGGTVISNVLVRKFQYGYFEFRAQWPIQGKGMFTALWMFASNVASNTALNKGQAEIDIVEVEGAPNTWSTTLHMLNNSGVGTSNALGTRSEDIGGWHTYGIDWQTSYIRFYRDNVLIYTVTGADATWYNGVYMDIRMNYSMDAPWFGAGLLSDGTTPSPLTMNIDYVRVYATKP